MNQEKFRFRISIRQKIMLPVVCLFLVAISIGAYLTVRMETRALTKQLTHSADVINRNISSVTQSAFWSLGWVYLEEFLHDLPLEQDNIIFAKVVNPMGEVYLADSREYYGRQIDSDLLGDDKMIFDDYFFEDHNENGILLVQPLVIGKETWHILTAMSLREVQEVVLSLIKRIALPAFILLLMTAGGTYLIARTISRPIVQLARSAEIFSRGNLDHEAVINTRDEVGLLGFEFNRMIKSLQSAQDQLKASENRYRTLIESASRARIGMALVLNHPSGQQLRYANHGLTEISGYSRKELLAMDFFQLFQNNDQQTIKNITCAGNDSTVDCSFRFQWTRKNGEESFVDCTFAAAEFEGSEAMVVFVRDVSNQVLAERQLKEYQTNLENTVAERTENLQQSIEELKETQKQLIQSEKLASIGRLAAGISHDFNNILHVINGYSQVLLSRIPEQSPERDTLVQIQKAGRRAAQLVRQLLDFSRQNTGNRTTLDLNHELSNAIDVLKRTIPRMIEIRIQLTDDLWPVYADPIKMEQVILNLSSNAADAMPQGGKLTIETANVILNEDFCREHLDISPGKYILITITDTGQGMHQDTLQNIFEPFFTTKEVGKGTGLGLPSAYGIVKTHGGTMHCRSTPGQGTAFQIYLPAHEDHEIRAVSETSTPLPATGKETILVIDDDRNIRELTTEMLEDLGYRVVCAENGKHGLEVYASTINDIDLVLLDMNMPVMGGYECMKKILEMNQDAVVLIASGYSPGIQADDLIKQGASGFIGKPFQFDQLASLIRELLEKKLQHLHT